MFEKKVEEVKKNVDDEAISDINLQGNVQEEKEKKAEKDV